MDKSQITHFSLVSGDYYTDKNSLHKSLKKLFRRHDKRFLSNHIEYMEKMYQEIVNECEKHSRCKVPNITLVFKDDYNDPYIRVAGISTITFYEGKEVTDGN